MPGREDEAIAIYPMRIFGIMLQEPVPQGIRHCGRTHGQAGMSGIRLLDGIGREYPDGINAQIFQGLRIGSRQIEFPFVDSKGIPKGWTIAGELTHRLRRTKMAMGEQNYGKRLTVETGSPRCLS